MQHRYILFQAYGNTGVLQECKLALLQLLKYSITDSFCVVLYTDNPGYFKEPLQQLKHYIIEPLTKEKIKEWRGTINFVQKITKE